MSLVLPALRLPVAAALLFLAGSASADGEPSAAELASARSLFNEARAAEERGNWNEALSKLDAVAKVKMTPQVRFHLGLCQEHTAKLLEALNNLERAASEGAEHNLPTVAEEAREHASSVRARLPKLFLALPAGVDAKVEVDGQVIASVLLGRAIAFDPGDHKIAASAPGLAFSGDVSLAEREERRIDVVFSAAPSSGAAVPVPAVPAPAPAVDASVSPDRSSTWGWVAVGVGGAVLVGASAAAIVRQGAVNEIEDLCPSHQNCPRSLESSQRTARTFGTTAAVLGVVGAGSVITGVVLLLRRPDPAAPRVGLAPWFTAGGAGAAGVVAW